MLHDRKPPVPTGRTAIAALLTLGGALSAGCHDAGGPSRDAAQSVVYVEETFQLDEPGGTWVFRTPALWTIAAEGDRRMLTMAPPPERAMLPGVIRPQEYAIYGRHRFRSFNLSCRVRVDSDPGVQGRAACIIFGRRDERHFYYLHLSNMSDPFHNALVRVDGDTCMSLIPRGFSPEPTAVGRDWHKIDIERDVDTGLIAIHVDSYDPDDEPWLEVYDRTYAWGHIGLGSITDHASFARLLIEGETD